MSLKVYAAAPFSRQQEVVALHERMRPLGLDPTAHWPYGSEKEAELTQSFARTLAARNDDDVARSHAVLVIGYPSEGAEMWSEARLALEWQIPVVWCGRRSLSSWRRGVSYAANIDAALAELQSWDVLVRRHWPTSDAWVRETIWNYLRDAEKVSAA